MRKKFIYAMMIVAGFTLSGCNNNKVSVSLDKVKLNTIVVKNNGKVESSIVEDFDKEYYDKGELETFILEEIEKFNKDTNSENIKMNSLSVKNGVAKMRIEYKNIDVYSAFNEVEAKLFTVEEAKKSKLIPNNFTAFSDSSKVSKEEVFNKNKEKVLVVSEKMDVVVEGKVKYYANGVVLNEQTVQASEDGNTVIVYK